MALTAARNTPRREDVLSSYPVAGFATLYAGALVVLLDSGGFAVPAGTASAGIAVGVARETVSGGGTNGLNRVDVERGTFRFNNSGGGDAIAHTEIGDACFIVDDETVAKTDNSGARQKAGVVVDVDAAGVWVRIGR